MQHSRPVAQIILIIRSAAYLQAAKHRARLRPGIVAGRAPSSKANSLTRVCSQAYLLAARCGQTQFSIFADCPIVLLLPLLPPSP